MPAYQTHTPPKDERCWGAQLACAHDGACTPRFWPGKRHFKTKFCPRCKALLVVPAARVRVLSSAALCRQFRNTHAGGMWNRMSSALGGGGYRVVNNTNGCVTPALVLFDAEPPPLAWPPLPEAWLTPEGDGVSLCVSRGTLVPTAVAGMRVPSEESLRSVTLRLQMSTNAVAEAAAAAEATMVPLALAPSACDHPGLAPLDAIGAEEEEQEEEGANTRPPPVSDKKTQRMMRNRASAASSRERKRKYIEHLEEQVDELSRVVQTLQEENTFWKVLDLPTEDGCVPSMETSPVSVCALVDAWAPL